MGYQVVAFTGSKISAPSGVPTYRDKEGLWAKYSIEIKDIGYEPIRLGDSCPHGGQWHPYIVWFGEVPLHFEEAARWVQSCQILIVVGTSLSVYPAAGLATMAPPQAHKFLIDPEGRPHSNDVEIIPESAEIGLPRLVEDLIKSGESLL